MELLTTDRNCARSLVCGGFGSAISYRQPSYLGTTPYLIDDLTATGVDNAPCLPKHVIDWVLLSVTFFLPF